MAVKTKAQLLADIAALLVPNTQIRATELKVLEIDIVDSMGQGWDKDGTNIKLTTITDNVGIGTATPSAKLTIVSGEIPGTNIYSETQSDDGALYSIMAHDYLNGFQVGNTDINGSISLSSLLVSANEAVVKINYRNGDGNTLINELTGNVGIGIDTPTEKLHVDGNALISGNITAANLTAGTYTPTLTNTTNVTSSTPRLTSWSRLGDIVTVYGSLDVTTTLAVATELQITLPVASNLATAFDLNGIGQASSAIATNAVLLADTGTDRARLTFIGLSIGGAGTIYFSFQYQVL